MTCQGPTTLTQFHSILFEENVCNEFLTIFINALSCSCSQQQLPQFDSKNEVAAEALAPSAATATDLILLPTVAHLQVLLHLPPPVAIIEVTSFTNSVLNSVNFSILISHSNRGKPVSNFNPLGTHIYSSTTRLVESSSTTGNQRNFDQFFWQLQMIGVLCNKTKQYCSIGLKPIIESQRPCGESTHPVLLPNGAVENVRESSS